MQNSVLLRVVICSVTLPCWLSPPLRQPLGIPEHERLGTGHEIEPVPAAVAERGEDEVKRADRAAVDVAGINALQRTAGVGLVDDDGAGTTGRTPTAGHC